MLQFGETLTLHLTYDAYETDCRHDLLRGERDLHVGSSGQAAT